MFLIMHTTKSPFYVNKNIKDQILYQTTSTEFLITFEAWAKLAQQWLVCAPLGIHFEPINKELMPLVTI